MQIGFKQKFKDICYIYCSLKRLRASYTSLLDLFISYSIIKQGFYQNCLRVQNYANIFFPHLTIELPKNISINKQTIKLIKNKQLLYRLIYSLSPVKLKIWKIYIKTYLKTRFIGSSKSLIDAPIFFDKKPDNSLQLCGNFWCLNNLIIKN